MNIDIGGALERVRARVKPGTLIQDISDPLTGEIDRRRVAAKFTNLESAVGDLADAVEHIDAQADAAPTGPHVTGPHVSEEQAP